MKFDVNNGAPSPRPQEVYPALSLNVVTSEIANQLGISGETAPDWFRSTNALLGMLVTSQSNPDVRAAFAAFGRQIAEANSDITPQSPDLPGSIAYDPKRFSGNREG